MISQRTKAALQAAKARGQKLGGFRGAVITDEARKASQASRTAKAKARAADLLPVVDEIRACGVTSLKGIADALTSKGIPTARGGSEWSAVQVQRALAAL